MAIKSSKQRPRTRVFIVDDHPIVRYGITRILNNEPDITVCGDADSAESAIQQIEKLRPDIIVVDISLKEMNGLQLTKLVHEHMPCVPVVILSMHDERMYANKALRAGASGYVMKEESSEKLVTAIRQILRGEIFVSEQVKKNIIHAFAGKDGSDTVSVIDRLSEREREIFTLIGVGNSSRAIADKLCLSVKTVETHRARIKDKLGLLDASKLTMAAMEWAKKENLAPICD